ncbi:MAG: hypothetical protein GW938_02935 [Leptospira sp.]|nr:hypothetical protein [Leptospira sp.]NCS93603.1 hypothetical protein [Leptospira sp.]
MIKNEISKLNRSIIFKKSFFFNFDNFCLLVFICFNLLNCQKNEDLKYVPPQLCSETVPGFGKTAKLQVVNSQLLFVAGETKANYLKSKDTLEDYNYLSKSLDGGNTWTKIDPPTSENLSNSTEEVQFIPDFINEEKGFVYADVEGESAFYTKNSGINYEKIPHNQNESIRAILASEDAILFYSESRGYSSSDPPRYPFLRLYNLNSKSVSEIQLPNLTSYAANSNIYARKFNNDIIVVYSSESSTTAVNKQKFYRSQDGGLSFQEIIPQVERKGIIYFYDTNLAYRFYENQLSRSTDIGITWNFVGEYPSSYPNNRGVPRFVSNQYLYSSFYQLFEQRKFYVSDFPGNNWVEISFPFGFSDFYFSNSFAKDEDRFFYIKNYSKIVTTAYPFLSSQELGDNPIYTHSSDTTTVKYRVEWMLLGYFCLVF